MYEEKERKKINIDWKSLIIKMVILLVAIFIIIWLISLINKKEDVNPSNITTNLQSMKEAALEYFTGSKLPENVNGKKKITLEEMFDSKLLVEFKDQNNESCDVLNSYAEATKINSSDYTIKVKLVCGNESDYVINTITEEVVENDASVEEENTSNDVENNEDVKDNTTESTNSSSNNTNNNTTSDKTTANTTSSNSNNNSNNNSSNNSNKNNNSSNNTTTNNSNNITHVSTNTNTNNNNNNNNNSSTVTCAYGKKEYNSVYPLAYVVSGNCAVSRSVLYQAKHANTATTIGANEYKILSNEIAALKQKTGADIYVESPIYTEVLNKDNTGYVGFQIMYVVKQKYGYTTKVIYQYYLNQNGDRKVIIDNRSSIKVEDTTIKATKVVLNESSLSLYVGDNYTLKATISPSNVTNKIVSWTSSNTKIATVDSNGKVTAISKGTAYITASIDGVSAQAKITVNEEETYKYYKFVTETHYSVSSTKTVGSYDWTIKFNNDNMHNLKVVDAGFVYENDYYKAYIYSLNKQISKVGVNSENTITEVSFETFKNASLTSKNFGFYLSIPYQLDNYWYVKAKVYVRSLNNVTPYDSTYLVPFYFTIQYVDLDDYIIIKDSEAPKYQGYVKIDN